ncbi:hypothetical protein JTB14_037422 [Gonioctena quinquepunctata]|nr:hypothetical protein JTB14_037422 [Gonioctena quinquepunctata]
MPTNELTDLKFDRGQTKGKLTRKKHYFDSKELNLRLRRFGIIGPESNNREEFENLRSSLEGAASKIIEAIEASAADYQISWQLLLDRFENERLIIYNHVKTMFDQIPPVEGLN